MAADPRSWMWSEACAMMARADEMQRQFFRPPLSESGGASWEPPIDVFETAGEVHLVAALPGVAASDIKVSAEGDTIVIRGVRKQLALTRGAVVHRLEIPYGRFERRVRLAGSRLKVAHSEFRDGCLMLGLEKLA